MALPGTILANKALDEVKGARKGFFRLYSQRRAKDQTHKIWGGFTTKQAHALRDNLESQGALNARFTYRYNFRGDPHLSGVRFEVKE